MRERVLTFTIMTLTRVSAAAVREEVEAMDVDMANRCARAALPSVTCDL